MRYKKARPNLYMYKELRRRLKFIKSKCYINIKGIQTYIFTYLTCIFNSCLLEYKHNNRLLI